MSQFKQLLINQGHFTKLLLFVVVFSALPIQVLTAATIGVGVGTGKIHLNEPVKPSLSYKLPSIAVFNNGDIASDYEMSIEFNESQPEQKPSENWFTFSPEQFKLEPGKSQQVDITLKPEYSAKPGDYFAYLEAHPIKKDESGNTAIRVAAATKLNFKVIPANFLMRVYYALQAFWLANKTLLIPTIAAFVITAVVLIAKKYLNIEVKRKKTTSSSDSNKKTTGTKE